MPSIEVIFIVHLLASAFMCGLCWFVQVVHYPLFLQIPVEDFPAYEKKNFVTAFLTVPVMILEMITGLYLLIEFQEFHHFLNVGLLGIIALSTILLQVPMHLKLAQSASETGIKRLINSNWIRTISWTLRLMLLGYLLFSNLDLNIPS